MTCTSAADSAAISLASHRARVHSGLLVNIFFYETNELKSRTWAFFFFETEFHCAVLAVLELAL